MEKTQTVERMDRLIRQFHSSTAQVDDEHFRSFAGLMSVYLRAYQRRQSGDLSLRFEEHELEYVSNTVAVIFDQPNLRAGVNRNGEHQ
jgi:hypothetical protein